MANPQLLEYIARELERGVTAESLREALLQAGWRSADIDDAFRALENGDTTPEASQKSTADLSTQTSLETVLARDQVRTNETNEKESVASPVNVDEQAKLQLPATGALSEQAKETHTVQEIIKPTPSEQTTPLLAMPNTIGSITASAPSRIKRVFLAIGALLIVSGAAGAGYYYISLRVLSTDELAFCTQEAQQCPDGSYVGRTGPNCEFSPCPNPIATSTSQIPDDWKTYRNEKYGFEIRYPNYLAHLEVKQKDDYGFVGAYIQFRKSNTDGGRADLFISIGSREDAKRQDELLKAIVPICEKGGCSTVDSFLCYVGCPSQLDATMLKMWDEKFADYQDAEGGTACKEISEGGFSLSQEHECQNVILNNILARESIYSSYMGGEAHWKHYDFFNKGIRYSINLRPFDDFENVFNLEEYLKKDTEMRDLIIVIRSFQFVSGR